MYKSRRYISLIFFLVFSAPLLCLIWSSFDLDAKNIEIWEFVLINQIPKLVKNTLFLGMGSIVLSSFLALFAAFGLEFTNLKFKKFWGKALMLPVVLPVYVMAYVYVVSFEWASPIMGFFREHKLFLLKDFQVKSPIAVTIVFSLALFPYILIPLRKQMRQIKGELFWAALSLSKSKWKVACKLIVPLLKKPLLIGSSLVLLEVLADFGAVSVFNFDTFTTAIYTSWSGFFSYPVASRLSLILLAVSFLILLMSEKRGKDNLQGYQCPRFYSTPFPLRGSSQFFLQSALFLLFFFSFLFPVAQLCKWSYSSWASLDFRAIFKLLTHTSLLAFLVVSVGISIVLSLCFFSRYKKRIPLDVKFVLLGYGIPGTIIGVAIYFLFVKVLGWSPNFYLMILALILGLTYRFIILPYRIISFEAEKISPYLEYSSVTLKQPLLTYLRKVWIPLLSPSTKFACLLLAIEVCKEMPLTLILRPVGFDTLSTKIFEYTSEGEWSYASAPSLLIVLLSLLFTLLFFKRTTYAENQ